MAREIFEAGAGYMEQTYNIHILEWWTPQYAQEEALILLGWDVETMGWGDEWWADILVSVDDDAERLAIVAEGTLGQPGTYYHAVAEL